MAPDQLRSAVESILREELRIVMPESGTDLLDSGLLDSLALVDLIAALERTFDIVVNLLELDLDDVRTVESITRMVDQLLGGP